jgi:hypothetical protein
MKVLGLAGSPRRDGNTEQLLDQVLAGAESRGAETEKVPLCTLSYRGCQHCDGCLRTGRCVIQDDMQELYPKLREMDALVFATPVFFMGPSSQAKAMIDRCQCLWVAKYELKQSINDTDAPRRGISISAGGTTLSDLFRPTQRILRALFTTLEVEPEGDLLYQDIDQKGAIQKHLTALQDAFQAGVRLVR